MGRKAGPLDLYKRLPRTNCGQCGEKTCMAFAAQLLERKYEPRDCPFLEGDVAEELALLLAPSIARLTFGIGKNMATIGGEDVMYRHQLAYFSPTAFAIEVHDEMPEDVLSERIAFVSCFSHERVGETLDLQALAIRNKSEDAGRFSECVNMVSSQSQKALILCSWNVKALEMALEDCGNKKPIIYAATKDNWGEIGALALRYDCPVVAFAENNLDELESTVGALQSLGVRQIAIDPGSNPSKKGLSSTLSNFIMLRMAGIHGKETILNKPLLGIASSVYLEGNGFEQQLMEVMMGAIFISRFCDLIILRNTEMWSLLPLLTLRQSIYTDPRKPKAVEAGLRKIGSVDECSHVLCTTNFALTYFTVESDIKSGNVSCFLLVFDTDGLGVDSSIAGGQLDAYKANEAIRKSGIGDLVSHRRIIIPGLAARISSDLERLSGWEVIVGPRDSSGIPGFVEKLEKERGKG